MTYVPAEVYTGLRNQALAMTADSVGSKDEVFGVLMETGYPKAVVTLLALADGTASLYFSNGGGMIGMGAHAGPASAARSLVSLAARHLSDLAPASGTPLPELGNTQFYVLARHGILTSSAKEADLGAKRHVLSPLFYAAQDLISEIRKVNEAQHKGSS